ncbi:tyramine/octopamine receptor-like [Actinia tenebrosa]|uniref:Tyramine/octopamine receptor-like n=1 Tax=Actinia tenebrosa TaxID=6105 RepID=A0A6P8ILB9_ACTTE|nr:tyramine/octopamine receptor-like [Actinia tenebrosa]
MPIEAAHLYYSPIWPFGKVLCRLWNTFFATFASLSVCTLCAISAERLWALLRPFRYDSSEISVKTLIILVSLWIYAFLSGVYSFFIWDVDEEGFCFSDLSAPFDKAAPILIINVLLPYATCLVAYGKIFKISHKQEKNICLTTVNCSNKINSKRKRIVSHLLVRKSTVTLGLLLGSFTLCCMPFLVFHIIDAAVEHLPNRLYVSSITKWLFFVCSSSNWALYGLLNKDYRKTMMEIVGNMMFFRKNRVAFVQNQELTIRVTISNK